MSISFSVRVPDKTHQKLRIMSAFRNESLNAIVNNALNESISDWENKYGELPSPPKEFQ